MIVAIDRTPTLDANRFRGVGAYTQNLIDEFKKGGFGVQFKFFDKSKNFPDADVIHYPYFDPFRLTLPLRSKNKVVVTVHDLIPLLFPDKYPKGVRGGLVWRRQKYALSRASQIITDSQSSKKDITRILGIQENKVHVIHLASDKIFSKQTISKKWNSKKFGIEKNFILYVGDVNFNKNVTGLVRSFSKLSGDYQLVIVGKAAADENVPETNELALLIKDLGVDSSVKRIGFVSDEDLLSLYKNASLYVQPSFYEGFGLPLLNAMTTGCLAVSSNKSSLPEIGGEAVDHFDPSNVWEMTQVVEKNLQLSKEEKAKKVQDQKNQAQKFNWHNTAVETVRVYIRAMSA